MNWGGLDISRLATAAAVGVAMLALPATASAAKVGVVGDALAIAGGSESSALTVTQSRDDLLVSDAALDLPDGKDCRRSGHGRKRLSCDADDVKKLVVVALDGNDSLDVSALPIATTFYGGDGDDVILARNGVADTIHCGSGSDSGSVDAIDVVATDCESAVARPLTETVQAPVMEPPAGDPVAPEDPDAPVADDPAADDPAEAEAGVEEAAPAADVTEAPVTVDMPSTVVLSPTGAIAVGLICTAQSGDCTGSIQIVEENGTVRARTQVGAARRGRRNVRKRRKAVVLGHARFSVPAGETDEVTVRLSRAGRRRIIKKRKKRKTRARIVIAVRSPEGTISTTTRTITIAAPRQRGTSGRAR